MKLVLYNGNLKPPHFIHLLASKLSEKKHTVHIAGTANHLFKKKKKNIIYVPTDSNEVGLLCIHLMSTTLKIMISNPGIFFKILKLAIKSRKRLKLKVKQFLIWSKLILLKADVVHIQWASHIALFEDILEEHFFKIIISLRGRLVNVSPYADENLKALYVNNFPKVDGIHAVSYDILKNLKNLDIEVHKTTVIYSGLELKSIPVKARHDRDTTLKLLSVGRFNWIKGYNYTLLAVKELILKKIAVHYTIIAEGDDEELIYMIDDLDLQKHVTLISKLPHEEVLQMMTKSGLLVVSSVSEGLSNVVLEAMAVGLPVLSSNCGGMKEVIKDGENGWLYENRNVQELALAIEQFSKLDTKEVVEVVSEAKRFINEHHNVEQMCDQMIKFYHEL